MLSAVPTFAYVVVMLFTGATAQLLTDRTVTCQSQSMLVSLSFAQPFSGVVYANQYYQTDACRWHGNGTSRMNLEVPLNMNEQGEAPFCGVEVEQATGEFSVMLVITPMPGLLVEGMQGLQVRCEYNTGDVTLTLPMGPDGHTGIFISPQSAAGVVTGSGGSPFLQMHIRDGHGIGGNLIQAASVGQRITLDIVMQDTTIYDFYVHDCFAHDGTSSPDASITIVDTDGCAVRLSRAVDVPAFTTPPQSGQAKHVYVHMYGFQFTTSQLVYFECQVRPCLQSCNRPQCLAGSGRSKRATVISNKPMESGLSKRTAESLPDEDYKLKAILQIKPQRINNVIPARDDPLPSAQKGSFGANATQQSNKVCLNAQVAMAILIIFIIVCVVSVGVTAFMCYRAHMDSKARRYNNHSQSITPSGYYTPSIGATASRPASTLMGQPMGQQIGGCLSPASVASSSMAGGHHNGGAHF